MKKRNLVFIGLIVYVAGIVLYLVVGNLIEGIGLKEHYYNDLRSYAKGIVFSAGMDYLNSSESYRLNGNPGILSNISSISAAFGMESCEILLEKDGRYYYSFDTAIPSKTGQYVEFIHPGEQWIEGIGKRGVYSSLKELDGKKSGSFYTKVIGGKDAAIIVGFHFGDKNEIFSAGIFLWIYSGLTGLYFLVLILPFIILYARSTRKEHEQMVQLIHTDQLTFLPSRTKLLIDLKKMDNPTIIIINIDSFKQINSVFGTKAGDFVLIGVANRIKFLLPDPNYKVYRLHSDEFAIVADDDIDPDRLIVFLEYLVTGIADKIFFYNRNEISISVTVGIAKASMLIDPDEEEIWQSLVTYASTALHAARRNNLNFLIYDERSEYFSNPADNVNWLNIIRSAIKDDRIVPFCQAIYNNKTNKIEKFECLVRLIDESNGIVPPSNFLDVAKKTRLLNHISRIMLEKAVEYFEDTPYEFSVNLAFSDIKNASLLVFIEDLLSKHPKAAKRLVLEILESDGIGDFEILQDFCKKVKHHGVKIAIDDFGSGYSNYENILKLGVDFLKIDASLVRELPVSKHCLVIVQSITMFASQLGIQTIAEFVSSREIFDTVAGLGIGFSQGYYIGKPGPVEEVLNALGKD
ncbi:MAG: hypothetical protein A2Y33_12180 [Spirochaetes bacterium GWF1_51_8]|nr:MAG: hypothetical protein A2Y33_12180 [Spirochaetes bacterium GWF1_51_8]